ncbi:uncharacterized protein LOC114307667 [Camellia sinensis]|uniref:uncharacterized protein LOC114307667 n=1 Tax=Camellia sinensis TaxID=4442 RepID=UPI001035945F|nr:uncharacterized protein LOC114307667 [Camellia sinensis]
MVVEYLLTFLEIRRLKSRMFSAILDNEGKWEIDALNDLVSPQAIQEILKLHRHRFLTFTDTLFWVGSTCGNYTTASAYKIISNQTIDEGNWTWLQKIKVPQKLKSFIWLIVKTWTIYSENAASPKLFGLKFKTPTGGRRIWKDRNKLVFENQFTPIQVSLKNIRNYAHEINEAFQSALHPSPSHPSLIKWNSPPASKLKLNLDGCSKGNPGQAVYGGMLHDEYGTKEVAIESDSELAINQIQDGPCHNSPYQALIEDAKFLLQRCNCSLRYTPREGNICLNQLANIRVTQDEHVVVLDHPPKDLTALLIADITGVSEMRAWSLCVM